MEHQDFISKFAAQFEETDISEFQINTEFRDLDEWTSFIALYLMAMVEEEYEVILKADDIRKSKTIEDLFNIVQSKIKT